MTRMPDPNAKRALEKLKLEIANEFDANITKKERLDGTTVKSLVNRANKKTEKE